MRQPVVSIIIPSYNSKAFLQEAVTSALNQTYPFVEIIVIDDGSTDATTDLFPEFQKQGVSCYTIANGGASNARNKGLEKAKGEYIQFLDADDILAPTKIEKQLALLERQDADLCYTPWVNFEHDICDAQAQFRFSYLNHSKERSGKELMISYGMDDWFILPIAWLVRKDLIIKAGYWNLEITNNDDGEYFSRILFWANKVVCCNEILAYYRLTPDGLSILNSASKIDASYNSFLQIEALLLTCKDVRLLSYPKRLNYMQYKLTKKNYPQLAKRAAKNFDRIQAPSFLSKKRYYWWFIHSFGLYYGTKIYTFLQPVWRLILRNKK